MTCVVVFPCVSLLPLEPRCCLFVQHQALHYTQVSLTYHAVHPCRVALLTMTLPHSHVYLPLSTVPYRCVPCKPQSCILPASRCHPVWRVVTVCTYILPLCLLVVCFSMARFSVPDCPCVRLRCRLRVSTRSPHGDYFSFMPESLRGVFLSCRRASPCSV